MEDDADCDTVNKNVKMGADGNSSANSRLVALQARKQALEEKITLRNQELRRLCIQEAELTGVMPPEIPLEPGEQVPTFRRRVGTSFEYPQNLINKLNSVEESIPALETEIQVQRRIAEAALQLANNATISKSVKRKNLTLHQQTKQQLMTMEERLENLKSQAHSVQLQSLQNQQLKQKKKPRPPLESESSLNRNSSYSQQSDDSKSSHSMHSNVYPEQTHFTNVDIEPERYMSHRYSVVSRNTEPYLSDRDLQNSNVPNYVPEEVTATLDRLSINSYNRWNNGNSNNSQYLQQIYTHPQNQNIYAQQPQQVMHGLSPMSHGGSPGGHAQSPPHPNMAYPLYAQTLQHSSPRSRSHAADPRKYATMESSRPLYQDPHPHSHQHSHPHPRYSPNTFGVHMSPQSYKQLGYVEHVPAHHTYDEVSSAGLGGHWMKTETGELVWCPVVSHADVSKSWQNEKRFGSLDRRKGKRINNKHQSTCLENITKYPVVKSLSNSHRESVRQPAMHTAQTVTRTGSGRHNCQLVRAQSLGSVGVQTADNAWPSDDNSSCDSDNHSVGMNSRKPKQKDWYETSLDGPPPTESAVHSPQTPIPMVVQDDSYSVQSMNMSHAPLPSPHTPKMVLEIPAESNPSPMISESNLEMYNNNVLTDLPKNCTVVQAGLCKPYREVTKPFEMSDFYKYSTKFRERKEKDARQEGAVEHPKNQDIRYMNRRDVPQQRLAQTSESADEVDGAELVHKTIYQPLQPLKCQPYSPVNNSNFNRSFLSVGSPEIENTSLDTTVVLSNANVAENFSAEMNAWYQSHGHTPVNTNPSSSPSVGRTGATLV